MGTSFKTGLVTGPAILAVALLFGAIDTASARVNGQGGSDVIIGSTGLVGSSQDDRKSDPRSRRNCVNGQGGSDVIFGDHGSRNRSHGGNDVLLGDRGNDRARRGGFGNDLLLGEEGRQRQRPEPGPRRNCGERTGKRSKTR